MAMICTSKIDVADSVAPSDIDAVLTNAAWAISSTYHTVLKASPGTAIFGSRGSSPFFPPRVFVFEREHT